jgi:hypothetical protein
MLTRLKMAPTRDADYVAFNYAPSSARADVVDRFLYYCLLLIGSAGLAHATYYLFLGVANPLLDLHEFRQTQTAVSAYWIWRGGPWLAYETPVFGYPWAVPFEFPIYQMLVAALRALGIPIEIGGRLLSFCFYLGCLWPLWAFFRALNLPRIAFFAVAALFLWSPIYIFWGRTVLIESCALFFCLLWLALLAQYLKDATFGLLVGAILAGSMGILCKVTTFPAVAVLGGLLVLTDAYRAWAAKTLIVRLRVLAPATIIFVVPLAAEIAWIVFTDAVKQRNPFGALLTSSAASSWIFGSWEQRFGPELRSMLWYRSLPDIFGIAAAAALAIIGVALVSLRYTSAILAAALAFMVPLLVFSNLHLIHNYYQTANAIFALAALGIAIAAIAETRWRVLAPILLAVSVTGQIYFFHIIYAGIIAADLSNARIHRVAVLAREKTQPTDSLIVIGQDFSSVVAYYSERRTLTLPFTAPAALMRKIFENPQSFLGDSQFGGVVICPMLAIETVADLSKHYTGRMPLIDAFVAGRAIIGEVQGCQLLAPDR